MLLRYGKLSTSEVDSFAKHPDKISIADAPSWAMVSGTGFLDGAVDLAGDVALEAAHDFVFGFAFGEAAGEVVAGGLVAA